MKLGSEWFNPDERGARSAVELGFMSTTLSRHVALEYSGVKRGDVGTVFEFDVGAVDCGARLDPLSQYPGAGPTDPGRLAEAHHLFGECRGVFWSGCRPNGDDSAVIVEILFFGESEKEREREISRKRDRETERRTERQRAIGLALE